YRPDVKAAFPQSFVASGQMAAIRNWVRTSGGKEEGISELFSKYGYLLDRIGVAQHALACWRRRKDLQDAFPDAFTTEKGAQSYATWIEKYGTIEDAFAVGDGQAFLERRRGLLRPLMLYLQDSNLQQEFRILFSAQDRTRYIQWLLTEACSRNIVSP